MWIFSLEILCMNISWYCYSVRYFKCEYSKWLPSKNNFIIQIFFITYHNDAEFDVSFAVKYMFLRLDGMIKMRIICLNKYECDKKKQHQIKSPAKRISSD